MAYIGNAPAEAYTNTVKDSFNGTGSATAFTLSQPTLTNDVRVVVENVVQDPAVAYNVSGTALTFTSAPPSGTDNIYVVHLGPAIMTTVPPAEIADATTFASSVSVQGAFTSLGIDDNAAATAVTIDASGNVGIGTDTPDTLMELVGANPVLTIRDTDTGTATIDARLRLAESGAGGTLDNYFDIGYVADTFTIGSSAVANALTINRATGNIAATGSVVTQDEVRAEVVFYASNQDAPYMIAATTGYTGATTNWGTYGFQHRIKSDANGTPRVTIDSYTGEVYSLDKDGSAIFAGSVIVGKTSDDATVAGMALRGNGVGVFTRASSEALYANRLSTDGEIIKFAKDTVTVGSIGTEISTMLTLDTPLRYLQFSSGTSGNILIDGSAGTLRPNTDNVFDLGAGVYRYDNIYATNGTIITSDRNEKEAIASLTPTEMLVAARLSSSFKNFKRKSAVAKKGLDAARLHSGIIAQDVQDAFAAEGLDAGDYAMFISNTWWETQTDVPAVEAVAEELDADGVVLTEAVEAKDAYTRTDTYDTLEEAPVGATERTRLGVRYPELLAFVAAYSDQRFISIETRLAALETAP